MELSHFSNITDYAINSRHSIPETLPVSCPVSAMGQVSVAESFRLVCSRYSVQISSGLPADGFHGLPQFLHMNCKTVP